MERTSELSIRVPAQADRARRPADVVEPVQLRVRRVYAPDERPEVLVRVNGEWQRGVLRKWSQDATGAWWGSVAWGRSPGSRFLDTVPADQIWEDADRHPPAAPSDGA